MAHLSCRESREGVRSLQVGRRLGRTTGPDLWGQNEKTPPPDSPWANEVSDVFVVGGATAVGYL
ncbi:hypothetical protein B7L09_27175 [Pseudomonas mandelii]|nr:hypothetical protein B7L09_27175 [Pseudomonas mandelii]